MICVGPPDICGYVWMQNRAWRGWAKQTTTHVQRKSCVQCTISANKLRPQEAGVCNVFYSLSVCLSAVSLLVWCCCLCVHSFRRLLHMFMCLRGVLKHPTRISRKPRVLYTHIHKKKCRSTTETEREQKNGGLDEISLWNMSLERVRFVCLQLSVLIWVLCGILSEFTIAHREKLWYCIITNNGDLKYRSISGVYS